MASSLRAVIRHAHPKLPGTIGSLPEDGCLANLAGDYSYLSAGYYASQELETSGHCVRPTCREALDSYVVPLFLEKARAAGLPTPEYFLTNDYFDPPVLVDTVNPFMSRQSVVMKAAAQGRVAKSLTRNFTYAICCQKLSLKSNVKWFKAILGRTTSPGLDVLAQGIWSTFHLPLAKVRIITTPGKQPLLSAIRPLPLAALRPREIEFIHQGVEWPT